MKSAAPVLPEKKSPDSICKEIVQLNSKLCPDSSFQAGQAQLISSADFISFLSLFPVFVQRRKEVCLRC